MQNGLVVVEGTILLGQGRTLGEGDSDGFAALLGERACRSKERKGDGNKSCFAEHL